MLVSLRQPQITSTPVTDTYQLLALEFLNQVKQEVEDAVDWRCLYQTIDVTIPAGSYFAAIPGTNERSRVARAPIKGGGMTQAGYAPAIVGADAIVALVFDITTPTTTGQFPLKEMPLHELLYRFNNDNGTLTQMQTPEFFALSQANADSSLLGQNEAVLYVYPVVNNNRTIQITMCVPQSDFSATALQDSTGSANIVVPQYPVLMGLQWMLREERGEELSASGMFSEEKFREVLDDAVGVEEAEKGNSLDLVMV